MPGGAGFQPSTVWVWIWIYPGLIRLRVLVPSGFVANLLLAKEQHRSIEATSQSAAQVLRHFHIHPCSGSLRSLRYGISKDGCCKAHGELGRDATEDLGFHWFWRNRFELGLFTEHPFHFISPAPSEQPSDLHQAKQSELVAQNRKDANRSSGATNQQPQFCKCSSCGGSHIQQVTYWKGNQHFCDASTALKTANHQVVTTRGILSCQLKDVCVKVGPLSQWIEHAHQEHDAIPTVLICATLHPKKKLHTNWGINCKKQKKDALKKKMTLSMSKDITVAFQT